MQRIATQVWHFVFVMCHDVHTHPNLLPPQGDAGGGASRAQEDVTGARRREQPLLPHGSDAGAVHSGP